MSLIKAAGAGEVSTGFYDHLLDQSLKFDDGDAQYLTRTPASASNQKTWTWSSWVKLGRISGDMGWLWGAQGQTAIYISDGTNTSLRVNGVGGGDTATTLRLRDPSAWYHFVVAVDTTDSTAGDRLKIYVNGVRQTAFDFNTNPTLNADTNVNSTNTHIIGYRSFSSDQAFDGYLAEVNFIDGAALTPSSFGETKDGIWVPKDTSGLTFGTNGFHLTFKDDVVSEGFNTVTYTGTSAGQSISGVGFSPAFVWVKSRGGTEYPKHFDVVRGANKDLTFAATGAEGSLSDALMSFDGDGFTLGDDGNEVVNKPSGAMVAWCWEAGGTPTADNSAGAGATPTAGSVKIDGSNLGSALGGSIAATRISADTSKGFSVVKYTGNYQSATIAHGLGAEPKWILLKNLTQTADWVVYHSSLDIAGNEYLRLNQSNAVYTSSTVWGGTAATSTVFTTGANGLTNNNGESYVAYCWAEVSGYSKFDSYSGNGSSTGPTVTTGFRPAYVMVKRADSSGHWYIWDTTRHPSNPNDNVLYANLNNAESVGSSYAIEVTATGFQIKHSGSDINSSGGTYIYMAFADTREAAFFKDVTTNGNHWTPVNLDYRDSVPDVPTNNFAVLNPLSSYSTIALSEGNLKASESANVGRTAFSSIALQSGKWYFEAYVQTAGTYVGIGLSDDSYTGSSYTGDSANSYGYLSHTGNKYNNGAAVGYGATFTAGDIVSAAFDVTTGTLTFYKNGVSQGTAFTSISLEQFFTVTSRNGVIIANFGQDSSFAGNHATENSNADGNGHGSFAYAPPSGFLALCSQNLPDVEIIDGTDNFNTVLYTGTGSSNAITGVGFSPDFTWIKKRNGTTDHQLVNSVVGYPNGTLLSNQTDAEYTAAARVDSADADGFTVSSPGQVNASSDTYVAWNWLAGTAFSNDASATSVGTIDSEGQVNTTAGFSIIKYTGTGSNGTVAHGLSSAPELVIVKERSGTGQWSVQSTALSAANKVVHLQSTAAEATKADHFNSTLPTSTVFSVGTSGNTNGNTNTFIAFCFHSVEGYSKVGSYTGNGNANGTFVYTGFRPAWIIIKASDSTQTWWMHDNKRDVDNVVEHNLGANLSSVEDDDYPVIDFLSNGFKCRSTDTSHNGNGNVIIYLAFADQPFKFSNAR